jgi:hypothetical protein
MWTDPGNIRIYMNLEIGIFLAVKAAGGGSCRISANEYSCTHGAQRNFGDLTPYLTYALKGTRRQVVLAHSVDRTTLISFSKAANR